MSFQTVFKYIFSLLFGCVSFGAAFLSECSYGSECGVHYAFDWDNNVVHMPTKLIVYHNSDGSNREVSTEFFTILHDQVELEKLGLFGYKIRNTSFLNFEDDPSGQKNNFLSDLKKTIEEDQTMAWKGPQWDSFISVLNDPILAKKVSIVTARKQSPEAILSGLTYLRDINLVKYLPSVDHIWAVGNPKFGDKMQKIYGENLALSGEDSTNSSQNKAFLIRLELDRLSKYASSCEQDPILLEFSDDDINNIDSIKAMVQQYNESDVRAKVSLRLNYTGVGAGDIYPSTQLLQFSSPPLNYKVNTSNSLKLGEFRRFLGGQVVSESRDLDEPMADPYTVVQYKASQFDQVLIDDTSLEIEGEEVGVNVKWFISKMENFIGKKAVFRCLLGIHEKGRIFIYESTLVGSIVQSRGRNIGFLPYFLPEGSTLTLGEALPDEINPRFHAINKFKAKIPDQVLPVLKTWEGKFQ